MRYSFISFSASLLKETVVPSMLSYETIANISFQLCCLECVEFSLPLKHQGIWKPQTAETPTYLSVSKMKTRSPSENEELILYLP